ncbi:hypothetical protein KI387_010609, partial [Taxus chinensis]
GKDQSLGVDLPGSIPAIEPLALDPSTISLVKETVSVVQDSTQILSLFQEGITLGLGADAASLEKWVNEKDELILSIDEDSGELNNCLEDVPVDLPLDNNQ